MLKIFLKGIQFENKLCHCRMNGKNSEDHLDYGKHEGKHKKKYCSFLIQSFREAHIGTVPKEKFIKYYSLTCCSKKVKSKILAQPKVKR